MRWRVGPVIAVAVSILVACQGTPRLASEGCPTALAGGVLVEEDGQLALATAPGLVLQVKWPEGVRVGRVGQGLALVGVFGQVIGRAGDMVSVGGGYVGDTFHACGDIEVGGPGS